MRAVCNKRYGGFVKKRQEMRTAREVIYLVELAARLEMLKPELSSDLALFGGRAAAAIAALKRAMHEKSNRSP